MYEVPPDFEMMDERMVEVLRAKSGSERLRMVSSMGETARGLIRSNVRAQHPEWDEKTVEREVARRFSRGAC